MLPQTPQSLDQVVKTTSYVRRFTTNLTSRTNIQVNPMKHFSSKHACSNNPLPSPTSPSPAALLSLMRMARWWSCRSVPHTDCTSASGGGHDSLAEHRPLSPGLPAAGAPRGLDRQIPRQRGCPADRAGVSHRHATPRRPGRVHPLHEVRSLARYQQACGPLSLHHTHQHAQAKRSAGRGRLLFRLSKISSRVRTYCVLREASRHASEHVCFTFAHDGSTMCIPNT